MRGRTRAAWPPLAALPLIAFAPWTALAGTGLQAPPDDALPVAVRDGEVAHVAVRSVPFASGSEGLDESTAAALDAFAAAVATDCFLSAQAIGHVLPGPAADGDTLAAHRLARARAATVAAALVHAGLPQEAVASVWDVQFSVRQPRVTLWAFSRPVGDDCDGAPLPGAVAAASAATAPAAAAAASSEPAPGIHLPPPAQAASGAAGDFRALAQDAAAVAAAQPPAPSPAVASSQVAAAVPSTDPEPAPGIYRPRANPSPVASPRGPEVAPPPPPPPSGAPGPVAVAAAIVAPPPDATTGGGPAATRPPTAGAAEPNAGPDAAAALSGVADADGVEGRPAQVEITFEPDSSYLPAGAEAELARLTRSLPADGRRWAVQIEAAVGDEAGALPPDQAQAYNEWLAGRRQGRVEAWLVGNAAAAASLQVERGFLPRDASRRVRVRARPLP